MNELLETARPFIRFSVTATLNIGSRKTCLVHLVAPFA